MKKLYLGDIISSDKYDDSGKIINSRNSGLQEEFYEVNDKLSARTLNRPIREAYEDAEADYVNLQTADKVLLGQKENGIIPDVLEEFSSNGVIVDNFFHKENFLRVPTGGLYVKAKNEFEEEYAFTFTEDQQYKKDIFIDNDHLALTIIHRPNLELFERQIAEHFCLDLNNQNTNINIDYKIYDENGEQKILYFYNITFNEYIYTEKTVNSSDDSSTPATFMDIAPAYRTISSEGEELHTIFDVIRSIEGKLGSHLTEENNFFSLEEIINIAGLDETKAYSVVVNLDTDDSELIKVDEIPAFDDEAWINKRILFTGDTIIGTKYIKGKTYRSNGLQWIPEDIRYSYSRRFAIIETEYVENYNYFVKAFDVIFSRDGDKLIPNVTPYFEKIDRTTLHIKNIINTNTINRLVVERVNSNINLSEGHFPREEGDDNLTIGLCTLGYGVVIENDFRYYYMHNVMDWITQEFDFTHWYTHVENDMNLELKDGHDLIHEMDELTLVLDDDQIHNSVYRMRKRFLLITSEKPFEHILTDRKLTLKDGYELLHFVTRRFLHLSLKSDYERDPTKYDENYKTEVGKRNIAIGNGALKFTRYVGDDKPTDNIGIGYNALNSIQNGHENIELGGQDNVIRPEKLLNLGFNLNNPDVNKISIGEKNMFVGYHNGCAEQQVMDNNIVIGFDNDSFDNSIVFGKSNKVTGEKNFIVGNNIETSDSNQFLIGNEELNYFDPNGIIKKSKYFIKASSKGEFQLQFFADKVRFHSSMITVNGRIKTDEINITSLRSSKTDIIPTKHNAVEEINKVQIVDFFYKDDVYKSTPKIGFIADDTDIIFSTPAKNSMDVYNCIGMLMKAVQELSAENKLLREKLNLGD